MIRTGLARLLPFILAGSIAMAAEAGAAAPPVAISRIDCGSFEVDDLGVFSDVGFYRGVKKRLVASCYLVCHGDRYLLWDTGLDGALAGKGRDKERNVLARRIVDQLADGGLKAADIDYVGISHYHYDHTGQLADFPDATLLEGKTDWDIVKVWKPAELRYRHWLSGGGKLDLIEGDKDVFGDGTVTVIHLPVTPKALTACWYNWRAARC